MSFSERRYESHGTGNSIFGIRFTLWVGPNAVIPIIPNAKPAGYYLIQLTTRKFDVKKNSFLRKDCFGPAGKPNSLLHEGGLKYIKGSICSNRQFIIL
jgi:hypothetical protein